MSEQLVEDWYWHSLYIAGRILPINYMDLDEDDEQVRIGYQVPHGEAPIHMADGHPVRLVVLQYTLFTIQDVLKH